MGAREQRGQVLSHLSFGSLARSSLPLGQNPGLRFSNHANELTENCIIYLMKFCPCFVG